MYFVRADAVLAVDHEPHRREPLLKTDRRVLEYRPDLQRELLARVLRVALEHPRIRQIGNVEGAATRALDIAVWPAETDHELMAVVRVGEEQDCLMKSRRSLAGVHAENFNMPCQSTILLPNLVPTLSLPRASHVGPRIAGTKLILRFAQDSRTSTATPSTSS